jgi:hypothetical protein
MLGRKPLRELELLREIALSIEHIKTTRRTKTKGRSKGGGSDAAVASAINDAGSRLEGWEDLNSNRLNVIRYGRDNAKLGSLSLILTAVRAIIDNDQARIPLAELDRRYSQKLGPVLKQRVSQLFQGQEVDHETALAVRGAWQFFYLSPIDRQHKRHPEYRGIGVFVHQAARTARSVDFFVLSSHGRWEGEAFINQSHLYLMCSDASRSEAAFFLMNRPRAVQPHLAGVGAGLERWIERSIRPALGFFCFGTKWEAQVAADEPKHPLLDRTIKRAIDKIPLEDHEQQLLRSHFCKPYKPSEIKANYPSLYDYVHNVRINSKTTFTRDARPWLYLEWPD